MLILRMTDYVYESSIPSDTFIEDMIKTYYINGLTESTKSEASIKKTLYESLLETLPSRLDYRNNNIDVAAESLYSVAMNSNLSEHLRAPLIAILEGIGYSDKNQGEKHKNNGSFTFPSNRNDLTTPIYEEVQESDVYEFVLALSEANWIPFRHLNRYLQGLMESVYRTQQELMQILCEQGVAREVTEAISIECRSNVTESFPNEAILDTILESLIKGSNNSEVSKQLVTEEELETLTSDFLNDDDLSSLPDPQGEVYRTLSDFVSCIYQNLGIEGNYKDIINAINYFRSVYVKHPTKMVHNTAIILNLYLAKMADLCTDNEMKSTIQSEKTYLLDDMCDFRNVALSDGDASDEEYGEILKLWGTVFQRVSFGQHGGGFGRINTRNDDSFKIDIPDFEEPVTESTVSTGKRSSELIKALTESFEVLKDGTIKVTIPKKSTYMDEYAENHRLLLANQKAKNYEGMKYNLIYHLILIDSIEKNVMHNTKVKHDSALYEDAVKARSFAKNDISTYLPEVRQHVKNFDINRFYKEVRAEQSTFQINGVETAQGVKKIIKSILL